DDHSGLHQRQSRNTNHYQQPPHDHHHHHHHHHHHQHQQYNGSAQSTKRLHSPCLPNIKLPNSPAAVTLAILAIAVMALSLWFIMDKLMGCTYVHHASKT